MNYKKVEEYCKMQGISIHALENRCGLSNGIIGKAIKQGYDLSVSTLKKLERGTGIPVAEWLNES